MGSATTGWDRGHLHGAVRSGFHQLGTTGAPRLLTLPAGTRPRSRLVTPRRYIPRAVAAVGRRLTGNRSCPTRALAWRSRRKAMLESAVPCPIGVGIATDRRPNRKRLSPRQSPRTELTVPGDPSPALRRANPCLGRDAFVVIANCALGRGCCFSCRVILASLGTARPAYGWAKVPIQ